MPSKTYQRRKPDAPLLSLSAAAKALNSSPGHVRRLADAGHLRPLSFAVYQQPRFLRSEVTCLARSRIVWQRYYRCSYRPRTRRTRAALQREQQLLRAYGQYVVKRAEAWLEGRNDLPPSLAPPPLPLLDAAIAQAEAEAATVEEEDRTEYIGRLLGESPQEIAELKQMRAEWQAEMNTPILCRGCNGAYPPDEQHFPDPQATRPRCFACLCTRRGSIARRNAGPPDAETLQYMELLRRDPCAYCGSTEGPTEIDHLVPVAAGGLSHWSNLTAACKRCNRRKRDKPLLVFLAELAAERRQGLDAVKDRRNSGAAEA